LYPGSSSTNVISSVGRGNVPGGLNDCLAILNCVGKFYLSLIFCCLVGPYKNATKWRIGACNFPGLSKSTFRIKYPSVSDLA